MKKSLLLISQTIGQFVNIVTGDHKYSLCIREDLQPSIQMQLSKKQKNFPYFFAPFQKSTLNFKQFGKKDDPDALYISAIADCEIRG